MDGVQTSHSHPIFAHVLDERHHGLIGTLGLTLAPGRCDISTLGQRYERSLTADLDVLKAQGYTHIVVHLEDYEILAINEASGGSDYFKEAEQRGMTIIHFPVNDGGVPSIIALHKYVQQVIKLLAEGRRVLVHCRAGLGRTGLFAAACLVASTGMDAQEAMHVVRTVRDHRCIENADQERVIHEFAAHLAEHHGGKLHRAAKHA